MMAADPEPTQWQIVDDDGIVDATNLTEEQAGRYLTRCSNEGVDLYMQEMN